jgi:hypothetical protein
LLDVGLELHLGILILLAHLLAHFLHRPAEVGKRDDGVSLLFQIDIRHRLGRQIDDTDSVRGGHRHPIAFDCYGGPHGFARLL